MIYRYHLATLTREYHPVSAASLEEAANKLGIKNDVFISYYREPVDNDKSRRVLINEEER